MSSTSKKHLIVLSGPTAVGKSDLCLELAARYQCPIISADSRQIYKELCIGTAKPSKEILAQTKHYFVDHRSITEDYSVGQYESEVIAQLNELFTVHDTIILSGGTGLYIDAVLYGLDQFPKVDPEILHSLEKDFSTNGLEGLLEKLQALDPKYYATVDRRNSRRILRALGVCISAQKPYSSFLSHSPKQRFFDFTKFVLSRDRDVLYQRINDRVDKMITAGLEEEVLNLKNHLHRKSLQTVGYQEWRPYVLNQKNKEEVIELIKQNTRRYAKRQLTWFRRANDWKLLEANNSSSTNLTKIHGLISQKI